MLEEGHFYFNKAADVLDLSSKIRQMLLAPNRIVKVEIITEDDHDQLMHHFGFRVQHNSARGPAKGGLRFHPSMDEEQVIRFETGGTVVSFNFFGAFLADPESKYVAVHEGVEDVQGVSTQRLGLQPRGAAAFRKATVWVATESRLLVRVQIHDENGSVRTLTLSDVRLDPVLSEDYFTFTPPPGARVITR